MILILNTVITKCLSVLLRYFGFNSHFLCRPRFSSFGRCPPLYSGRVSLLSSRCSNKPNNLLAKLQSAPARFEHHFCFQIFTYLLHVAIKSSNNCLQTARFENWTLRTEYSNPATAITSVFKLNRLLKIFFMGSLRTVTLLSSLTQHSIRMTMV